MRRKTRPRFDRIPRTSSHALAVESFVSVRLDDDRRNEGVENEGGKRVGKLGIGSKREEAGSVTRSQGQIDDDETDKRRKEHGGEEGGGCEAKKRLVGSARWSVRSMSAR